jgi:hypothetical protein
MLMVVTTYEVETTEIVIAQRVNRRPGACKLLALTPPTSTRARGCSSSAANTPEVTPLLVFLVVPVHLPTPGSPA